MLIAIDFDGVLAKFDSWEGLASAGEPIEENVEKVKELHKKGHTFIIFTCRLNKKNESEHDLAEKTIKDWLVKYEIEYLFSGMTGNKIGADIYWDDRAVFTIDQLDERIKKLTIEQAVKKRKRNINWRGKHVNLDKFESLFDDEN